MSIGDAKVLKMDVGARVESPSCSHEGVDELVVLGPSDAAFPKSQVQLVIEMGLVIGATVEDDREGATGVDASTNGGEDQLCDGYKDAANALVPNAQDRLAVCLT